jgi:hypothetical protein
MAVLASKGWVHEGKGRWHHPGFDDDCTHTFETAWAEQDNTGPRPANAPPLTLTPGFICDVCESYYDKDVVHHAGPCSDPNGHHWKPGYPTAARAGAAEPGRDPAYPNGTIIRGPSFGEPKRIVTGIVTGQNSRGFDEWWVDTIDRDELPTNHVLVTQPIEVLRFAGEMARRYPRAETAPPLASSSDIDLLVETANGGHHEDCDQGRCHCAVHVAEVGLRALGGAKGEDGYWVGPEKAGPAGGGERE